MDTVPPARLFLNLAQNVFTQMLAHKPGQTHFVALEA
jgi:hypothetical protein